MSSVKAVATQVGVNGVVAVLVPTGLTVDGRSGWNILGVTINLPTLNNGLVQTADCTGVLQVNTESGSQSFLDPDNICTAYFLQNGMAASTSAFMVDPLKQIQLPVPRLTVQPELFIYFFTSGMSVALYAEVEIFYDIVKLSDLEVMRLMQGGA
jgi:hypothetical protein